MTALPSFVEANTKLFHGIAGGIASRLAELAERGVPNLPRAIDAEQRKMVTHRGQALSYYVDRKLDGNRPLVLLHSVNACASPYEMRPLFELYRGTRPVYALDLPGFGFAGREARPYTIDLYVDSIREFLARVKDLDGEADVIALSLTGEFAAEVARAHKGLVHTLALLSPTGFEREAGHTSLLARMKRVIREPVVSRVLFDAIVSRPSTRYLLGKSFVGKPDAGLVSYAYATSHQRGAFRAPIAFFSGDLFTPNVREEVYAHVPAPSLVVYDADPFTRFDALPDFVASHPHWRSARLTPSRGMPQFERLSALAGELEKLWHHR